MRELIERFFILENAGGKRIENERALQLELALMFRNLGYDARFEAIQNVPANARSTKKQKSNLDIMVEKNGEFVAIELKVPLAGRVPETMYDYCADISFIEAIVESGQAQTGYSVMMTNDTGYWSGNLTTGIYAPFRQSEFTLHGEIEKPTGAQKTKLFLGGEYNLHWKSVGNTNLMRGARFLSAEYSGGPLARKSER